MTDNQTPKIEVTKMDIDHMSWGPDGLTPAGSVIEGCIRVPVTVSLDMLAEGPVIDAELITSTLERMFGYPRLTVDIKLTQMRVGAVAYALPEDKNGR